MFSTQRGKKNSLGSIKVLAPLINISCLIYGEYKVSLYTLNNNLEHWYVSLNYRNECYGVFFLNEISWRGRTTHGQSTKQEYKSTY